GTDEAVTALFASGQALYAAGAFHVIGSAQTSGATRFDGTNWSALSGGVDFAPTCFAVYGTNLFAGGFLATDIPATLSDLPVPGQPGGHNGNVICQWTDQGWQIVLGTNTGWRVGVAGLTATSSQLYAGGVFSQFDPDCPFALHPTVNLLEWDGTTWSPRCGGGI